MHKPTAWAAIAGILAVAGPAVAGTTTTDLDLNPVTVTQPGLYGEGVIPRFDPTLGMLTDVTLTVTGVITGMAAGTPALNVEFSDQADHIFGLYGAAFMLDGPITPQGTDFTITTEGGYSAQNVALFDHLFPGPTLETFVFANGFDGLVTFTTDTLTYTYTPVPEPVTAAILLVPVLGLITWRRLSRQRQAHVREQSGRA